MGPGIHPVRIARDNSRVPHPQRRGGVRRDPKLRSRGNRSRAIQQQIRPLDSQGAVLKGSRIEAGGNLQDSDRDVLVDLGVEQLPLTTLPVPTVLT